MPSHSGSPTLAVLVSDPAAVSAHRYRGDLPLSHIEADVVPNRTWKIPRNSLLAPNDVRVRYRLNHCNHLQIPSVESFAPRATIHCLKMTPRTDNPRTQLPPATDSIDNTVERLVRTLALTTFLLWVGASSILPLLPEYLRHRGSSDGLVGVVMASYFVAALACQYPAGRLADRIGRRPVLLGGLLCYAVGSFGFLAPVGPAVDIGFRSLQGAGQEQPRWRPWP